MVKANQREIPSYLKALDRRYQAVVLFGKDEGLVRERADLFARQVVVDTNDPFSVAKPGLADLKERPGLLADELATLSLTGERRLVRLDHASDAATVPLEIALECDAGENLLVITAGDLNPASKLRKLAEKAPNALALACYADEGANLERTIRETLSKDKLQIEPGALSYLSGALEGNRMIARSELDKLALFMGTTGRDTVTLEDAEALIGDASELQLGKIASAVSGGDTRVLDALLERAAIGGENGIAIIRAVSRRFQQLDFVKGEIDAGKEPRAAMDALRPKIFFKDQDAFRMHVMRWRRPRIREALDVLMSAEADCKSVQAPADTLAARTCLRIAASTAKARRS